MIFNKIISIILVYLFLATNARAEVPCDFKGLSVGDKKSVAEIMNTLGVKKYKINPQKPTFLIEQYGILGAANMTDEKIGPYCEDDHCRISTGIITVGINIPAKVFILFSKEQHQIQAINVSVNSLNWDDLVPILYGKYGTQWSIEKSPMGIVGLKNKRSVSVEQITMIHKAGGRNIKTKDTCELSVSKYNSVFEQVDSLGLNQSVFEIKIISKNF